MVRGFYAGYVYYTHVVFVRVRLIIKIAPVFAFVREYISVCRIETAN